MPKRALAESKEPLSSAARRSASAIPVGTQFTPDVIDLRAFLDAICTQSGKSDLEAVIWKAPVRIKPREQPPTKRLRSLPLEAAVQYGLLTKQYEATPLAHELRGLSDNEIFRAFARHIMLRLGGLRVVEAAQQMKLDGLGVTGDTLAGYLTDQGFNVGVHNTQINSLRLWLERAGVFRRRRFDVDDFGKAEILGLDDAGIAALVEVGSDPDLREFTLALCRIRPEGRIAAADVRAAAEASCNRRLDRGNTVKTFLKPLHRLGLIDFETGGTASGKTSVLWTTDKFDTDILVPFLEHTVKDLDAALTDYYRRGRSQVYADLDAAVSSDDTFVKGQALEAFAIFVMRLLGLRFVKWRKQSLRESGGAEIDAVMAGVMGFVPTRWQVQCKNKPGGTVRLDDVAKEVSLLPMTKATHILVLANARYTQPAIDYASAVMRDSPVTIFLLNAADFERVRANPAALPVILRAKAESISRLGRTGLDWLGD